MPCVDCSTATQWLGIELCYWQDDLLEHYKNVLPTHILKNVEAAFVFEFVVMEVGSGACYVYVLPRRL